MGKAWLVEFSPGAWQEHSLSSLDADFHGRFCFLHVLFFSEYGLSRLHSLEQYRYWSPVPWRSLQTGNAQCSACLTPHDEVTRCRLLPSLLCSLQCQPGSENLQITVNHQAHHDHVRRKDNVFASLSFRHEIFPWRTTEGSPCQFFNQDWVTYSLTCREVLWHVRLSRAHIQPEPRETGTDSRLSFMFPTAVVCLHTAWSVISTQCGHSKRQATK